VERKVWQWCSLPECMNDQADKLAKTVLLHAISGVNVIKGGFPFELVKIKLSGKWVSGLLVDLHARPLNRAGVNTQHKHFFRE
jgi:hypothetical protein